ncbi:DUF6403 family protein [Micromonospora radicis]|uniref:Uncharacterized protein n=1 Tax=Micromonospora radicis TaxID=1894971 RepID=A0A418N0Z2_9ACTN|nr:DUF6403 family protein [Micromonospora radicis]RIV41188.1 hypothetical protein D2L64_00155 [Micromonospora radicis]
MSPSLLSWLFGGVLLLAAGFVTTLLPRRLARTRQTRVAWSTARAAIDSAAVSRDATAVRVPEAERLLARAELLAAEHGGVVAAQAASEHARRADELWRERA